jgi:hypothetical protein
LAAPGGFGANRQEFGGGDDAAEPFVVGYYQIGGISFPLII